MQFSERDFKSFDYDVDAVAMIAAIGLWTQMPQTEQTTFFSSVRTPYVDNRLPRNKKDRTPTLAKISQESVRHWKNERDNKTKGKLALSLLADIASEQFLPEGYISDLKICGYEVSRKGLVRSVHPDHVRELNEFALQQSLDLKTVSDVAGGISTEKLGNAQRNLILSPEINRFIDNYFVQRKPTKGYQQYRLKSLQLAQKVRKHYYDAGFRLSDLMSLWGINYNLSDTKDILYSKVSQPRASDRLLEATAKLGFSQGKIQESEAFQLRAKQLNLPSEYPDNKTRNEQLLVESMNVLYFEKLTGISIKDKPIIFTGKPGSRSRGVNVSYLNSNEELVNIPLVDGDAPTPQLRKTLVHELTHALQVFLITKYYGYDAWSHVDSGIREVFAMLADNSIQSIYLDSSETTADYFRPALIDWFQPLYALSQLELHQGMEEHGYKMTGRQLRQLENEIDSKLSTYYVMTRDGLTLDLSERSLPFNAIKPTDGLVYLVGEINANQTSESKQVNEKSEESFLVKQWGKNWLGNIEAYKLFVCALIASRNFVSTDDVDTYMQNLYTQEGAAGVEKILDDHSIKFG